MIRHQIEIIASNFKKLFSILVFVGFSSDAVCVDHLQISYALCDEVYRSRSFALLTCRFIGSQGPASSPCRAGYSPMTIFATTPIAIAFKARAPENGWPGLILSGNAVAVAPAKSASETLDQSKKWNHPSAAGGGTDMQQQAKMRESHERRNVGSE